jgi:hypothetical protein
MRVYYQLPLFVPIAIQVRAHDLIETGDFRQAARVLRKQAQLRRSEAVEAASVLQSGDVLPDFPMPDQADLTVRVRDLRESGRRKEAVFMVRSERETSIAEAESFVDLA